MECKLKCTAVSKKRIDWIDFAKGITILLVIVSHCVNGSHGGDLIRGLIFSFHMPLFFILSCMTFRCSVDMDEFRKKSKKAAKHLLVPAVIIVVLRIVLQDTANGVQVLLSTSYWKRKLMTMLLSSGYVSWVGIMKVDALGIPWFLVALFVSRTLFDYLHLNCMSGNLLINCCLFSLVGVLFGRSGHMPFSLDIAMAILPLLWIGNQLKHYDFSRHAAKKMLAYGIVWLLTFFVMYDSGEAYLEFAIRRYPMFPLSYVTAICGTMMVCEGSILAIDWLGKWAKPMMYLGKNSLYMLGVHCMDGLWRFWWKDGISTLRRVAADILVFCLVMLLRNVITTLKTRKRG